MRSGLLVILAAALGVVAACSSVRATPAEAGVGCSAGGSTLSVLDCSLAPVVPSLEPGYRPVRRLRPASAPAGCRASELVFYAARDWLRLAQKLAEHASPCADYYVSIPPLVRDKTIARPNQAWQIRALGPRFHAMAEIHWATWAAWVKATGRGWYQAGLEARRRMAEAGFDVGLGDIWAVNEFPSSVRRDRSSARRDARELVRGLYDGDGRHVQGAVFVIGVRQGTDDASLYKARLKRWLGDTPFWVDMQRTVRFWAQEVYGDARRWGVPGAPNDARREYLNDFLQHSARLGAAAPDGYAAARAFLARAHTPIANAGWQWPTGLGWTMVTGDQMRHFASSQTYALRNFSSGRAGPNRFGFAWAPNNASSMQYDEFVAQSGELLDRLGSAIAESASVWRLDPGIFACSSLGIDWCRADVAGASFTDAWKIFDTWKAPDSRADPRLVSSLRRLVGRLARR